MKILRALRNIFHKVATVNAGSEYTRKLNWYKKLRKESLLKIAYKEFALNWKSMMLEELLKDGRLKDPGAEGTLSACITSARTALAACSLSEHCLSICATFTLHCCSTSAILDSHCAKSSVLASSNLSCHECSIWRTLDSLVRRIFSSSWSAMLSPSWQDNLIFRRSSVFNVSLFWKSNLRSSEQPQVLSRLQFPSPDSWAITSLYPSLLAISIGVSPWAFRMLMRQSECISNCTVLGCLHLAASWRAVFPCCIKWIGKRSELTVTLEVHTTRMQIWIHLYQQFL